MTTNNKSDTRKCGECRKRAVRLAPIDYEQTFEIGGEPHAVRIPGLEVYLCGECGNYSLGLEALDKIEQAVAAIAATAQEKA